MRIWKNWDDYVDQEPITLAQLEQWHAELIWQAASSHPGFIEVHPRVPCLIRWLRLSWGLS